MKRIACKDINPGTDCAFEVDGKTVKEVADKMMEHIKMEHQDDLAKMKMDMSEKEILKMVENKVHF
ncbi:MAG: DUF1059 domain-containing protein [Candidatus Paceibacterota bacterium]|jgi:predicted small metal-binding protein